MRHFWLCQAQSVKSNWRLKSRWILSEHGQCSLSPLQSYLSLAVTLLPPGGGYSTIARLDGLSTSITHFMDSESTIFTSRILRGKYMDKLVNPLGTVLTQMFLCLTMSL